MKAQTILFLLLVAVGCTLIMFMCNGKSCSRPQVPDYKSQLDSLLKSSSAKEKELMDAGKFLMNEVARQDKIIDSLKAEKNKAVTNETALGKTVRRLSYKVIHDTTITFIDCDSLARNSDEYITAVDSTRYVYENLLDAMNEQLYLKDSIIANKNETIELWKGTANKAADIAAEANKKLSAALRKNKHQKKWPVIAAVAGFVAGLLVK